MRVWQKRHSITAHRLHSFSSIFLVPQNFWMNRAEAKNTVPFLIRKRLNCCNFICSLSSIPNTFISIWYFRFFRFFLFFFWFFLGHNVRWPCDRTLKWMSKNESMRFTGRHSDIFSTDIMNVDLLGDYYYWWWLLVVTRLNGWRVFFLSIQTVYWPPKNAKCNRTG